jgi:pimeloyl-ACP methyl ester carboxylesterase
MKWLILPGLDGTGLLSKRLAQQADGTATTVTYPVDEIETYSQTISRIQAQLPREPFVLLAESFSGPAALQIASFGIPQLQAVVLSATFVRSPFPPTVLRVASLIIPFMPAFLPALRFFLAEGSSDEEVDEVQCAIKRVSPAVLKNRLLELSKLNQLAEAPTPQCPVLFLRPMRERLIPKRRYEELAQLFPRIESVSIDGPHLLFHTRPQMVSRAIRQFIATKETQ